MSSLIEQQRAIYNKLFRQQDAIWHESGARARLSGAAVWILYAICDTPEPITQSYLCHEWHFSKQTVNSAVKSLEKRGLLSLQKLPGAGNCKTITLTESGTAFCRQHILPLIQADREAFASFSDEERTLLLSLLQRQLDLLKEGTQNI